MAIRKAVKTSQDKFISGAPDAEAVPKQVEVKGVMRGNKRQISLTLSPGMLPKIDQAADELGISRAAWISMTIARALKSDNH
jgi:hypothetical protein